MMRDDDLFELFRALDNGAPTDAPPYANDLWAELDEALTRQQSSGRKPPIADADIIELQRSADLDAAITRQQSSGRKPPIADADIIELQPRPDPGTTRFPMRGLAAAAVVVIAGLLLILALQFERAEDVITTQPPNPTSTVDPTASTQPASTTSSVVPIPGPRLTVPSEACQRYAESQPTLLDLSERAPDGNLTVEEIEAATTALSVLQADLSASGEYIDSDIRRIGAALEALKEASIEIQMGLHEQAAGSLSAASSSVEELLLPLGAGEDVAPLCVDGAR
jgi:hypothetical protein